MTNFNGLTDAQAERLHYLCEEAAEVIQAANKVLRHGYASRNPEDPNGMDNREHLSTEIGQLILAIFMLTTTGEIPQEIVEYACDKKRRSLHKWMHHQPEEVLSRL